MLIVEKNIMQVNEQNKIKPFIHFFFFTNIGSQHAILKPDFSLNNKPKTNFRAVKSLSSQMCTAVRNPWVNVPSFIRPIPSAGYLGCFQFVGVLQAAPCQRRPLPLQAGLVSLQMRFAASAMWRPQSAAIHFSATFSGWDSHTQSTLLTKSCLLHTQSSLNYSHMCILPVGKKNSFLTLLKLTVRKSRNRCLPTPSQSRDLKSIKEARPWWKTVDAGWLWVLQARSHPWELLWPVPGSLPPPSAARFLLHLFQVHVSSAAIWQLLSM